MFWHFHKADILKLRALKYDVWEGKNVPRTWGFTFPSKKDIYIKA